MSASARSLTESRLGKKSAPVIEEAVITPRLAGPNGELRMFDAFLQVDLAHVTMLAERAILPGTAARDLMRGLLRLRDAGAGALSIDPALGTMLLQIENWLTREVGQNASGMLQLARSRIDQGPAIIRVLVRDRLLTTLTGLLDLQQTLLLRAREWRDVIMPGYTHLQHSQPWVLGHYLLAQHDAFARDVERLFQTYARVNRSALGAAAMSGTSWPIDRRRTAALLGHPEVIVNSKDASFINGMDFLPELAANLSILVANAGRLGSDLYLWSTWEFGMVDLDASLCGTSSIMPQKKNPYALERLRALSGEALGWMPAQLGLLRSPSSTDCDVNFASNHYLGYFDATQWVLRLTDESVRTLAIDRARMLERAAANWTTASDLADRIVRAADLDFRRAHHVVGLLVRRATEAGRAPASIRSADVDAAAQEVLGKPLHLPDDLVRDALDAERFVRTRVSEGSVHPDEVGKQLLQAEDLLARERSRLAAEQARLATARAELERAARAVAALD